ncbi:MAG TPA: hypothetical protein VFP72_05305, partial [Kineosporiaceae bacterium]|nr:hypothetical protein [Kineosporiaceae bacterium]
GGRVLWAAGAGCRPDRVDSPPAALTLTEAEARLLRGQGVDAVSLLRHPVIAPPPLPDRGHDGGRPRVAVLVDGLHAALLPDAVEAVLAAFTGPAGPPVLDLLPQLPVVLGGRTAGAAHPWQRSRILRRADLVLALGVCPALDLGLAEAAGYGVPGLRLQLRPVDGPQAVPAGLPLPDGKGPVADRLASVLAATLRTCVVDEPAADEPALDEPAHDGFAAPDGSAGRGAGQVVSPPGALRDWLRRVATPAPHSPSGTGTPAESTGPPAPATDPATPPAAHPTDH